MSTTISTFKFFSSPQKEEAWLEQMAQRGWFLKRVSSFYSYTFQQGAPERRAYKLDYRTFRSSQDREDYLVLFKDSGWQAVMPREMNGAYYFYSSQDGPERDIFSDDVSRAQRNLRYAQMCTYSLIPAMLPWLVLYLTGNIQLRNIGYMTPGLWEMTGTRFIFHFLFETPFVLLRSGAYFLPLLLVILIIAFLLQYYREYRKAVRQQGL